MKTIAYIPVKLNNQRTPGKNTKRFSDGTPLINFVQAELVKLKNKGVVDEVYVYCSDESIKDYLIKGVEFYKRPDYLDLPETKGSAIYDQFFNDVKADIYVLAHATSPFVTAEHIEECVTNVKSGNYDSAFCAKKIQNFLWQYNKPLNFELSNPLRTQDMAPIYMELSTPYVYTKDTWLKYKSRSGIKPYICEASEIEAIDIDYPEDFYLADVVYSNMIKKYEE